MIKKQQLYKALLAAWLLFGSSAVFAQVKIGTNPTTINAANNLEVEASTAGRKVAVDKTTGKVTIADGTQGDGNILTSDANGLATWKPAPGTTVITGTYTPPPSVLISTGFPNATYTPDCPITLNKGVYSLFYYAQYDYLAFADPTNTTTMNATFPRWIYFDFSVVSGAADFPSYRFLNTGLNNGPHVIPVISTFQVAAKVEQLVIVTADNTIIKPHFWALPRSGYVQNLGPIIAVKL